MLSDAEIRPIVSACHGDPFAWHGLAHSIELTVPPPATAFGEGSA